MAKYLVQTTEIYRVNNEAEAKTLIEEAKDESISNLKKYNCEYRNQKQKGEIVQEWYKVTLTKAFNEEREPEVEINIDYEMQGE